MKPSNEQCIDFLGRFILANCDNDRYTRKTLISNALCNLEVLCDAAATLPDACVSETAETGTQLDLTCAGEWLDISTAPKDGKNILGCIAGVDRSQGEMFWDGRWTCWDGENHLRTTMVNPTHWMPMPEPPVDTKCLCAARSEADCGCPDADWTPSSIIELQKSVREINAQLEDIHTGIGLMQVGQQTTHSRLLALEGQAVEPQELRCTYCDNTGDVHDMTGEWRGECKEHQTKDGISFTDPPQFEVGGTCDQGRIIHIEPSGLRVLVGLDNRVVFGTEITNYKPPVRRKAWLMSFGTDGMPTLLDQPGAVASYVKNGYTAQPGYWTPEAK